MSYTIRVRSRMRHPTPKGHAHVDHWEFIDGEAIRRKVWETKWKTRGGEKRQAADNYRGCGCLFFVLFAPPSSLTKRSGAIHCALIQIIESAVAHCNWATATYTNIRHTHINYGTTMQGLQTIQQSTYITHILSYWQKHSNLTPNLELTCISIIMSPITVVC